MDLRYPIGEFKYDGPNTREQQAVLIDQIDEEPRNLCEAVKDLFPEQLDTPYRPDGWTVRQVTHHLADSHLNSYVRFKWTLTEEEPTIKAYDEVRWSDLDDARSAPPEVSLLLLEALHRRRILLLRSLTAADFKRTYRHRHTGLMTLDKALSLYAWHGRHHISHITSLREKLGWQ